MSRAIGYQGEDIAVNYLQSQGYQIIERNFFIKAVGEIDTIAYDKEVLVFIEVKYYKAGSLRDLHESVDYKKQQKLYKTAKYYMQRHKIVDRFTRFDVLLIAYDGVSQVKSIELLKDAFRG